MSSLFRVRVEDINEQSCSLRLFIIHPDQKRFYATNAFALQLLYEPLNLPGHTQGALKNELSSKDVRNPDIVYQKQDEYIETVEYMERKNYPVKVNFSDMTQQEQQDYWANEDGLPQAVIKISVTQSKWIEHLRIGEIWESTAYNM